MPCTCMQRLPSPMSSSKCAFLVGQAEDEMHCTSVKGVIGHVHGKGPTFSLQGRLNISIRFELPPFSLSDWLNKVLSSTLSSVHITLACNCPLTWLKTGSGFKKNWKGANKESPNLNEGVYPLPLTILLN